MFSDKLDDNEKRAPAEAGRSITIMFSANLNRDPTFDSSQQSIDFKRQSTFSFERGDNLVRMDTALFPACQSMEARWQGIFQRTLRMVSNLETFRYFLTCDFFYFFLFSQDSLTARSLPMINGKPYTICGIFWMLIIPPFKILH